MTSHPLAVMPLPLPLTLSIASITLIVIFYHLWNKYKAGTAPRTQTSDLDKPKDPYRSIEPIPDFRWQDESPIAFRPFKPKYHLTMSIENMSLDELVAVDKTYLDRINLRRQLMHDHASTIGTRPACEAAVSEFYTWMTRIYLPQRFPSMYAVRQTEKGSQLRNLVTSDSIPLTPPSTHSALQTLGAHVDTDFLFLLPSPETGKYHLEAFVGCFPSGFSTLDKLGLPLAAIHKPVPGYAAKLEKSMDRFFANIPIGKFVRRANWTVTTNDKLFSETGTHLYDDKEEASKNEKTLDVSSPSVEDDILRQRSEVVVENCRLRCERQTVHRLPETKAVVFAFKTYLYTLKEVKDDGSGPALAEAIEGLGLGNVPEFKYYKRGVVWGEKVREYLLGLEK